VLKGKTHASAVVSASTLDSFKRRLRSLPDWWRGQNNKVTK